MWFSFVACTALFLGPSLPLAGQATPEPAAQEPVYFSEQETPWWMPKGQLDVTSERIRIVPYYPNLRLDRSRARLELGWKSALGFGVGEVALRSSLGSDGNAFNAPRYDQEPSNGVWLQRASITLPVARESYFGELVLGLQGNPLLSQESLWDHDLALVGVGLRAAFRQEEAGVQEAGLRMVKGRVRTFPGETTDLTAIQGVFRFETGAYAWTAHAGRWELGWDVGRNRFKSAVDPEDTRRQNLRLDALGFGVQNTGSWPWELRGIHHRNPATGATGGEFQAWLGSRAYLWRPQLGYIWQRFDFTGTLMPVNGDEWWFTRGARGPRYLLVLPLPHQLRLTLSYLRQQRYGDDDVLERTALSLQWQF